VTIERSRIPVSANSKVRGMGLAVRVKTSTPTDIRLMASLCETPNRCSSSTTKRPRSLYLIDSFKSLCVPTTTSTEPSARPARVSRASWSVTKRLSSATFTGKDAKRSTKVVKCWVASSVVGTTTATWAKRWISTTSWITAGISLSSDARATYKVLKINMCNT